VRPVFAPPPDDSHVSASDRHVFKVSIMLFISILIIVGFFGGVYLLYGFMTKNLDSGKTNSTESAGSPMGAEAAERPDTNWFVYRDGVHGFSFSYPSHSRFEVVSESLMEIEFGELLVSVRLEAPGNWEEQSATPNSVYSKFYAYPGRTDTGILFIAQRGSSAVQYSQNLFERITSSFEWVDGPSN